MGLIKKQPRNWHVRSGQPLTEMDKRILYFQNKGHLVPKRELIKTPEQIEGIRKAGVLNTGVLDLVAEKIHEGMTTLEIDQLVYDFTTKHGGIPAPLNYEGFPKSCCTSINEVVCHGIPSEEDVLEEGDIINVDCTTILDGYFADASRMFLIGNVKDEDRKLVEATKERQRLIKEIVKNDLLKKVANKSVSELHTMKELQAYGKLHGYKKGWCFYMAKRKGILKSRK